MSDWFSIRREKRTPVADFWHTLRLGILIGVLFAAILPYFL